MLIFLPVLCSQQITFQLAIVIISALEVVETVIVFNRQLVSITPWRPVLFFGEPPVNKSFDPASGLQFSRI